LKHIQADIDLNQVIEDGEDQTIGWRAQGAARHIGKSAEKETLD